MRESHLKASDRHDSAALYVTGQARFTDDLPFPADGLHIALGLSDKAHALITSCDVTACLASPGVVTVLTAADIPGVNDASPVAGDDPVFAEGRSNIMVKPSLRWLPRAQKQHEWQCIKLMSLMKTCQLV